MALMLKACPRCGQGDVELPRSPEDDPNCIQCGFEVNPNSVERLKNIRLGKITVITDYDDDDDTSGEY